MENNQPRGQEQDQNLRTGQNSEGLMESQENNESLNTASADQPVQDLREGAEGSGRSYDYGAEGSPEQGLPGNAASE
jgi:hypothetical protein